MDNDASLNPYAASASAASGWSSPEVPVRSGWLVTICVTAIALGALGALGDPAYNLFLHTAPSGERLEQTFHWHWELHPRLRVIAGLERATALAVNPAAPEFAASILRSHLQA